MAMLVAPYLLSMAATRRRAVDRFHADDLSAGKATNRVGL
jgi:hypothetical protein